MRRQLIGLFALAIGVATQPATACSIALTAAGTLALSGDATRLDSTVSGGAGAVLTLLNLNLSKATITVSAPSLNSYPPGFNPGAATTSVAYVGGGLLTGVNQGYTASGSTFELPALLSVASILTVHNRVVSTVGFSTGTYQTRTVITCS